MPSMVLHPTDFSAVSELAFVHALRIALDNRALLSLLHVDESSRRDDAHWSDYPSVREHLERWGVLPPGSSRSDVVDGLGLAVEKVVGFGSAAESVAGYVRERAIDLVVMGTEGRAGLPRWLEPSTAESLARETHVPTLFVPRGCTPFVHPGTGRTSLKRILIGVTSEPAPARGIRAALHLLGEVGSGPVDVTLLHVGETEPAPELDPASFAGRGRWRVHLRQEPGAPGTVLPHIAATEAVDLIVLVTAGHQGLLDALRGSSSERILREAPCPVLAVPVDW